MHLVLATSLKKILYRRKSVNSSNKYSHPTGVKYLSSMSYKLKTAIIPFILKVSKKMPLALFKGYCVNLELIEGQKALFLYVNLSLHFLFTALKLKSRPKYAIALV